MEQRHSANRLRPAGSKGKPYAEPRRSAAILFEQGHFRPGKKRDLIGDVDVELGPGPSADPRAAELALGADPAGEPQRLPKRHCPPAADLKQLLAAVRFGLQLTVNPLDDPVA